MLTHILVCNLEVLQLFLTIQLIEIQPHGSTCRLLAATYFLGPGSRYFSSWF